MDLRLLLAKIHEKGCADLACGKNLPEGAAREPEKVIEQEGRKREKGGNNDGCGKGMSRCHPGQPNGEDVFAKTQYPIAEWFGTRVYSGARTGFRAMRSKGDSTSDKGGTPAPFRRGSSSGSVSKERGGGWTDESVDGVPDRVNVRNLVRKKFQKIQRDGDSQDPGMGESLQSRRETEHSEALEQAECRDRGVEIEAGRESSAQSEAERFERIHARP